MSRLDYVLRLFFGRSAMPRLVTLLSLLLTTTVGGNACAVETVRFRDGDTERTVVGKLLLEAQDGGVMLQTDEGRIWTIYPPDLIDRQSDEREFQPVAMDQMQQRLKDQLPPGFEVFRTSHYVIGYNSSEAYARRVGALYEQLYRGFYTYWQNQQWKLPPAEFPLVSLVLDDRKDFVKYAGAEIGETAESVIGYYHLGTNRMMTYNVPNFERNVATIIHEATHQLAYNSGMQRRYADNPMWVSEGLATYFESPDRRNPKKWRGIGRVNQINLARWRKYQRNRPAESLATLLSDDMRYRSSATAEAAYAEGWALSYFLIRTKRKQYVAYLKQLSEGELATERTKRERIKMFEQAFDTSLEQIERSFLAYMRRVR